MSSVTTSTGPSVGRVVGVATVSSSKERGLVKTMGGEPEVPVVEGAGEPVGSAKTELKVSEIPETGAGGTNPIPDSKVELMKARMAKGQVLSDEPVKFLSKTSDGVEVASVSLDTQVLPLRTSVVGMESSVDPGTSGPSSQTSVETKGQRVHLEPLAPLSPIVEEHEDVSPDMSALTLHPDDEEMDVVQKVNESDAAFKSVVEEYVVPTTPTPL